MEDTDNFDEYELKQLKKGDCIEKIIDGEKVMICGSPIKKISEEEE
jgi:hypothetical protein